MTMLEDRPATIGDGPLMERFSFSVMCPDCPLGYLERVGDEAVDGNVRIVHTLRCTSCHRDLRLLIRLSGRYGSPPVPRLPFAPLYHAAAVSGMSVLADWTDVDIRDLCRWRAEDGIPVSRCDEIAVRLGLHPGEVWGFDAWEAAAAILDADPDPRSRVP